MANKGNYLKKLKKITGIQDSEILYNMENANLNNPNTCIYCGNKTKFINFSRGYEKYCPQCKSSRIHLFKEGYAEYVKNNFLEQYQNIWNSTNCIDPFDNESYTANTVPFSSYVLKVKSKYNAHSKFWIIKKQCLYCGEYFEVSVFNQTKRNTCLKHHGMDLLFPMNISLNLKENINFSNLFSFKQYLNDLSYTKFYSLLMNNFDYIKNFNLQNFSLKIFIKHSIKDNFIKNSIFLDAFDNKVKNKIVYFDDIPIKIYFKHNKWSYVSKRWNSILYKNEELTCRWCGKHISDKTHYELMFDKDNNPFFIYEDKLCSLDCRNEMYKFQNNYNSKFINEINYLKNKQSECMKNKIANGDFTPNIVNSLTRKSICCEEFPNYKFRSSWELIFWYYNKNNISYENYEKIRIPYTLNNKKHVYITDFIDEKNKILYEIKPEKKVISEENEAKFSAAQKWCVENEYSFVIITEKYFNDLSNFKDDISFYTNHLKGYKKP